jgi:hypothetical protein
MPAHGRTASGLVRVIQRAEVDLGVDVDLWRRVHERRALLERTARWVLVVMEDVGAHDLLEPAAADDQDPVEAQLRSVCVRV